MRALAVDDEIAMLSDLSMAVSASPDIESVTEISNCIEAVEYVKKHAIDIAFLDIQMRGMGGMELAEKIVDIWPDCKIVFCTGYDEYAIEAFKMHASGYLLKPVTAEDVQKEIDHIKGQKMKNRYLTVKCFGNFEVLADGEPLVFKRKKTKEMLAFLVDRAGAGVTSRQICAVLWEDETNDGKNMNYLWQLLGDLRSCLKQIGLEKILLKKGNNYSVDTRYLDCDYLKYCDTGEPMFYGEYMMQYSWAEGTCARLLEHKIKK